MLIFHSGQYAAYVWSAYGITFAAITAGVLVTLRSYRKARRDLAAIKRRL